MIARDQIARRHRAMEDRVLQISAVSGTGTTSPGRVSSVLPSAPERLTRRGQVGVGRRLASFGRVVEEAGDLVHEAAAIGRRIDAERLRERGGAAGDRHVLGDGGCGGVTRRRRRRAQQQNQQSGRRPAP